MNEAFEKIISQIGELANYNGNAYLDSADVIEIVQEVAEEFATGTNVGTNGWIACSDRLPEKDGMYLCTQNSYDLATNKKIIRVSTELVEFYDGKWRRAKNLVVTHWQPLPEPFKERD